MKLTNEQKVTVEKILGWKPNKAMCLMIIEEMQAGKTIEEACYERTMPSIITLEDDQLPPEPEHPLQKRILVYGPNYKHKDKIK